MFHVESIAYFHVRFNFENESLKSSFLVSVAMLHKKWQERAPIQNVFQHVKNLFIATLNLLYFSH